MKGLLGLSMAIAILLVTNASCKKADPKKMDTLNALYERFKDGGITECKYNGQTVYSASINAYDVGGSIFDKDGNRIGVCNYAWVVEVDEICDQLTDCETIYMVQDNVWGQQPVDKYGLSSHNTPH